MNMPTSYRLRVSGLDHRKRRKVFIAKDASAPGRIYANFPRYASMTHEEVIALANALVDVIES